MYVDCDNHARNSVAVEVNEATIRQTSMQPKSYAYYEVELSRNKTQIGTRNFNFRQSSRSSTGRHIPREREKVALQMSSLNVKDYQADPSLH